MRFDWYTPIGELHASHQKTTDSPDPIFPLYVVYDEIEIFGHAPASDPGRWTVSVYVDGTLIGSRQFYIIDYDAIIERTDALEEQVAEIVSSYDQLVANYASIQEDYEELLSDYGDLRDTYDSLTITYEDQISNYNEILSDKATLQGEYNSLAEDYEELVLTTNQLADDYADVSEDVASMDARLKNSKNISYVAVALAVVFLGATLYMYTKK